MRIYSLQYIFLIVFFLLGGELFSQTRDLRFFEIGFRGKPDSVNVYAATADAAVLAVADRELALPEEKRRLHIAGLIARGTRYNNYLYDWHFVPGSWTLTDDLVGAPGGDPRNVDDQLAGYLVAGSEYQPLDSYLKREVSPDQVKEMAGLGSVKVYPNPARERVFIRFDNFPHPVEHLALYHSSGRMIRLIQTAPEMPGTVELDVTALASGMYVLEIRTERGHWSEKIMVK